MWIPIIPQSMFKEILWTSKQSQHVPPQGHANMIGCWGAGSMGTGGESFILLLPIRRQQHFISLSQVLNTCHAAYSIIITWITIVCFAWTPGPEWELEKKHRDTPTQPQPPARPHAMQTHHPISGLGVRKWILSLFNLRWTSYTINHAKLVRPLERLLELLETWYISQPARLFTKLLGKLSLQFG